MRNQNLLWLVTFGAACLMGCGTPESSGSTASDAETTGGGTTGGDTPVDPPAPTCSPAMDATGNTVTGQIYYDHNASDRSIYAMGIEDGVDEPIPGFNFTLFGVDGEQTVTTCVDGDYGFGELTDGVYVLTPDIANSVQPCSSKNCARRFPEAVREGEVVMVTFGDSVPVVGNAPFFPERLATLLSPLVTVDNRNVAVGGTTSPDWLPGTSHFENRLAPHIPDADVILISLGGNDLLMYVNSLGPAALSNIDGAIDGAHDMVDQIMGNILVTTSAIREINPTVDIVYCLYPNYGQAKTTMPWNLVGNFLGSDKLIALLSAARDSFPSTAGFVLADNYGAFEGLALDDYLYDSLHFNDEGQILYAETIFRTLGGVLVGPSPLEGGHTPLGEAHVISLVPMAGL